MIWINQYKSLLAQSTVVGKKTKALINRTLNGISKAGVFSGDLYETQLSLLKGILAEIVAGNPHLQTLADAIGQGMREGPSPNADPDGQLAQARQRAEALRWQAMGLTGDLRGDLNVLDFYLKNYQRIFGKAKRGRPSGGHNKPKPRARLDRSPNV